MLHDVAWCCMMPHNDAWCYMMQHDFMWCYMMPHGVICKIWIRVVDAAVLLLFYSRVPLFSVISLLNVFWFDGRHQRLLRAVRVVRMSQVLESLQLLLCSGGRVHTIRVSFRKERDPSVSEIRTIGQWSSCVSSLSSRFSGNALQLVQLGRIKIWTIMDTCHLLEFFRVCKLWSRSAWPYALQLEVKVLFWSLLLAVWAFDIL